MNPCIVALGALIAFWSVVIATLIYFFGVENIIRFGFAVMVVIFACAFVRAFGDAFIVGRSETLKREGTK